ncbi:hypothetical protein CYY_001622 [Polysphondylium violaceum]|uniref:Leucine-rich repeat-containing protein n=1 Tax=Polysphondylium violaceum TaxID=133409 RepID=A0A8J4V1G7_9MYCE|nr:hypothetical protein CYY_001622 [Polysphondylium violaceum]
MMINLPTWIIKQILQDIIDLVYYSHRVQKQRFRSDNSDSSNSNSDEDQDSIYLSCHHNNSNIYPLMNFKSKHKPMSSLENNNNNVLQIIYSLSLVCKLWLSILPKLNYPYIHISSLVEFKQLIHLCKEGIFKQNPIEFKHVNFHLHLDHKNLRDDNEGYKLLKLEIIQLYKEYFNQSKECAIIKLHRINNLNSNLQSNILEYIPNCQAIKELHIIGGLPYSTFLNLPYSLKKMITTLTIERSLSDLSSPKLLESLFLSPMTVKSNSLCSITDLSLIDNQCDGSTVDILEKVLKYNKTLKYLNLRNNFIGQGEEINRFFGSLAINTTLVYLNLSNNLIGCDDESMIHLSYCLQENTTLSVLILDNNRITDKGILPLLQSIYYKNNGLKELSICENEIGSEESIQLIASILNSHKHFKISVSSNYFQHKSFDAILQTCKQIKKKTRNHFNNFQIVK